MILQFGNYTLDEGLLELRFGGELVEAEPQVFRLITYLVRNRDRVVSKDELIAEIWDQRVVSDAALNSRINLARKAIGDSGRAQALIKTFPRRGYRFVAVATESTNGAGLERPSFEPQEKPSIAVLPFTDVSAEIEQQYFSHGITEDIITALSRIRHFFVIARNTTFSTEFQSTEPREVAQQLDVRYLLKGSVRKSDNRVRMTVQLIDVESGRHLWADKYDRQIGDIFAVQDEITHMVVGVIGPEVDRAERDRALLTPPENMDAWDNLCRGRWYLYKFEGASIAKAQEYITEAIRLDPTFSQAHSTLAEAKFVCFFTGLTNTPLEDLQEGFDAARKAVLLDDKDPVAYAVLGVIYLMRREHASAAEALQQAIAINPSSTNAHHWYGLVHAFDGRPDEAISEQDLATRLSPYDPRLWAFMTVRAYASLNAEQFENALEWALKAIRQPNAPRNPYIVQIIALSYLGRVDQMRVATNALLQHFPDSTTSNIQASIPFKRPEDVALWMRGLRGAGLP